MNITRPTAHHRYKNGRLPDSSPHNLPNESGTLHALAEERGPYASRDGRPDLPLFTLCSLCVLTWGQYSRPFVSQIWHGDRTKWHSRTITLTDVRRSRRCCDTPMSHGWHPRERPIPDNRPL